MEPLDDRGSTEDWLLPEDRDPGPRPPSLEQQVAEALATARASADRAAAAERAAERAGAEATAGIDELARRLEAALERFDPPAPRAVAAEAATPADRASIRSFEERADRIVQRLRVLERRPGSARAGGPRRYPSHPSRSV